MIIPPILKLAGGLWARGKVTAAQAEESALAERLSRLRYDPPTINLWQALKTGLVVIPLLFIALWFGKWWLRESIIEKFRVEQVRLEQVQLAKDRAINARHEAELATVRGQAATDMELQREELAEIAGRLAQAQDLLKAKGLSGWDQTTVDIINGVRPAPAKARRIKR